MFALKDPELWQQNAYINGVWLGAQHGHRFAVSNPATGEILAEVPRMGEVETGWAMDAAQQAWSTWRSKTAAERSKLLRKWYDLVLKHQEDLALILTSEQGKPLAEARAEIAYGASFIEWFAEEAKRVYGEIIPTTNLDRRFLVIKQPIGVCAAITPWNFPFAMLTRKVAPALAAGCTIIVKPSDLTPLSALALAELAQRAGLPPGVFNVIIGPPEAIGKALTSSPIVRKLSFTGSTKVGQKLMAESAPTIKKLSLELGGNAPFLVFDDAPLDAAIDGAMAAKYRNSGQTCICVNRFLVQSGIYDQFVNKLVLASERLQVGNGTWEGTQQGPLINEAAVSKIQGLLADAVEKGARIVCGGRRHALGRTFFEPTVVTDVQPHMAIAQEEIFGPVATIFKFQTEAEALQLANQTEYGLASYFYARDIGRIWRVAEGLEVGMVGINTGLITNEATPFGGIKSSGIGREGSRHGLDEYLEMKYLCMAGL